MKLVERLARALAAAQSGTDEWEAYDEAFQANLLEQARAGLEAIREPTAEMVDAGRDVGPAAPYGLGETREKWRVMVDAALSE